MRRVLRKVLRTTAAPVAGVLLTLHALTVRASAPGASHRPHPRLVYGPLPILSFKYMAAAMRAAGYETLTVAEELYRIHVDGDFDVLADGRPLPGRAPGPFGALAGLLGHEYRTFAWALERGDVFHSFFDGGFLRRTMLARLEVRLLHLAGKRLIVMPYGSDAAVPSRTRSLAWRNGLMRNYPALGRNEGRTLRWIDHLTRRADYVVACIVHAETLPHWDLLTTHFYPIDTDAWAPRPAGPDETGPVTVVHASNHRGMKGTEHVIAACEALRAEGYDVRLRLLEGVPNSEVREAMGSADIVVEQLLLGYALTAMEAMALGKPVLSNLEEPGYYEVHRWSTGLTDCPVVSTTPETVGDRLRELVTDASLRRRLGAAGREYVVRYHGYGAMAILWDAVYRRVWAGEPVDPREALPHRQTG